MKVIMYKSADGTLHESATACTQHDAKQAAAPAIEQLLMKDFGVQDKKSNVSLEDVLTWTCANAVTLVPILSAFLPPKASTPRKPREPGAARQGRKKTGATLANVAGVDSAATNSDSAPAVIAKAMASSESA